jgi:hypothetical protein
VIARAVAVVSVPKAAPANSFVLHAPLELLARIGLLPHVAPVRRAAAVGMIEWLADQYAAAGDPEDGVPANEIPTEVLVTSLAAAGHAPIGLALLARVRPAQPTTLLRGAMRAIAAQPDWQVRWHLDLPPNSSSAGGLYEAIRRAPQLGRPGSDFIYPLMSQVQDSGLAAELLGPVLADRFDVAAAGRTLTRVAAWSMVHDDPAQAPYGWSHALTMPQAVMALAGTAVTARTALAVAATFTLGFRAAHGTVELPDVIEPGAGTSWSVESLATAASLHEDAHLVKHTLACLHAAEDDPAGAPLYLQAAAHLAEWWGAPVG